MSASLKLTDIAKKWRDILKDSSDLRTYCQHKYNKAPSIFIGLNGKKFPDARHCPAIYILPKEKKEGILQQYEYSLLVGWSVKEPLALIDEERKIWSDSVTGELIEFLGVYDSDEFGQLIYEILNKSLLNKFPISKVEYNIEVNAHYPQFPGFMTITTEIVPAMGENLNYLN